MCAVSGFRCVEVYIEPVDVGSRMHSGGERVVADYTYELVLYRMFVIVVGLHKFQIQCGVIALSGILHSISKDRICVLEGVGSHCRWYVPVYSSS